MSYFSTAAQALGYVYLKQYDRAARVLRRMDQRGLALMCERIYTAQDENDLRRSVEIWVGRSTMRQARDFQTLHELKAALVAGGSVDEFWKFHTAVRTLDRAALLAWVRDELGENESEGGNNGPK